MEEVAVRRSGQRTRSAASFGMYRENYKRAFFPVFAENPGHAMCSIVGGEIVHKRPNNHSQLLHAVLCPVLARIGIPVTKAGLYI